MSEKSLNVPSVDIFGRAKALLYGNFNWNRDLNSNYCQSISDATVFEQTNLILELRTVVSVDEIK